MNAVGAQRGITCDLDSLLSCARLIAIGFGFEIQSGQSTLVWSRIIIILQIDNRWGGSYFRETYFLERSRCTAKDYARAILIAC